MNRGFKFFDDLARLYLKFTAARGVSVAAGATEATDVVVVGGELTFILPDGVKLATE